MSNLEAILDHQLHHLGLRDYHREYRFGAMAVGGPGKGLRNRLALAGLRDWRADFAFPDVMFLVEVEGGGWVSGRHNRGSGFREDMEKYHAAMSLGYTVYRCDGHLIKNGRAADLIFRLVEEMQ